ncbi:MAG: prepilin-type N-terminal cleavage/methylation domain-containing protein [Candidatus Omnitrophica bacterium]|nr:prepilin-type N-terminal cleavage/methylation domain-containing protein [Candidatus Omnitrophota bacterium]MDD5027348.1 prepilin-type N-terminal cleavage/methylation domain-containing protein [Candidatus Omnitrophota bacterium]MDD5661707.1 prepilin-type N-terminal cleavage/methylation domain-containing protein [Candidatus Omnitrophota bacterium]
MYKYGFTLIELIIVVIIVAILALVAIPRYYANVAKAQKSQVYSNLNNIIQAARAYYAVKGAWPAQDVFPITVTIDGDTIYNVANPDPNYTFWHYYHTSVTCASRGVYGTYAYKQPGNTCEYGLCTDAYTWGTCTP